MQRRNLEINILESTFFTGKNDVCITWFLLKIIGSLKNDICFIAKKRFKKSKDQRYRL